MKAKEKRRIPTFNRVRSDKEDTMRVCRVSCLVVIFMMMSLSQQSFAQFTKIWTGAGSTNNWSDPNNWEPLPPGGSPGVPTPSDNVLIPPGKWVHLDTNATVHDLFLEVDDFYFSTEFYIHDKHLTVEGDFTVGNGHGDGYPDIHLIMYDSLGVVTIKGTATFGAPNSLAEGTINFQGNLIQQHYGSAFRPNPDFLCVFNGAVPQTVHITHTNTPNHASILSSVKIHNPVGVTFETDIQVVGQLTVENGGKLIQADTLGTYFDDFLPQIDNGDYLVANTYPNLLIMSQDRVVPATTHLIILPVHTLKLNGHHLVVEGDLTVSDDPYDWFEKHLVMTNPADVLTVKGTATFGADSKLSTGTINIRGDLVQRYNSISFRPGGLLVFNGSNPQTITFSHPNNSYPQNVSIYNQSGLTLASNLEVAGSFDNFGKIVVPESYRLKLRGGSAVNHEEGIIEGTGEINILSTTFLNAGEISPGLSPGILTIRGNYPQDSTGVLNLELGGLIPDSTYDRLNITGNALLDGALNITAINNFTPSPGDSFRIMTYGSLTNSFVNVNIQNTGNITFETRYKTNALDLITVEFVNTPPAAADDWVSTPEDSAVTIPVLANDSDINGDVLFIQSIAALPTSGTVSIDAGDTTVTYKPSENFFGNDSFTYVIGDGNGGTDTANVFIEVLSVNDHPVISYLLPDTLHLIPITSDTLNIWEYVEDIETADSLLIYQFSAIPDTLNFVYSNTTGNIIISASDPQFHGEALMFLSVTDDSGATALDSIMIVVSPVTGIENNFEDGVISREYVLMQNYPNPFNPTTQIKYALPQPVDVSIIIYNSLGQRVKTLISQNQAAGNYNVLWDATNDAGQKVGSGLYFYVLQAGEYRAVKKMMLVK
jgi:hypothetical protein